MIYANNPSHSLPVETQMKRQMHSFDTLSTTLLYAILRLRQQVFMLEQQSIYDDIDNLDQQARHLTFLDENTRTLTAYMRFRLLADGTTVKLERVVVAKSQRGKGLGLGLMQFAFEQIDKIPQVKQIQLSAQVDVISFYQSLGFEAFGEVYDDGGIDHRDMQLNWQHRTKSSK
ncbi:GNAT family N-acetyltransferase [Aliiglaciecola sp. LCG003]|uniref:GNAT family N-acetyltransferase n=1 Tax=Aliiglaciecola sp. LCG003 TaxID=3053655 RepID=UPI002572B192|nr:GNAT family N-acetyltransferase [Aliiglaciecola sp. LCG003]WJG08259.1 GNAT family N-acetyltransferase [Aliiglaciecola sp. LCG003]